MAKGVFTGLFFILTFLPVSLPGKSYTNDVKPFTDIAKSYLLTVNGEVLWERNPHLRLPPASLTKIMTAVIVLEKAPSDVIVTVGKSAENETGTRLGLRSGEKIFAVYLLAALLLNSANDACHALAAHVAGDEARFVSLMNQKAKELGLKNTHFENACGHDQPGHYSTASDLAVLTEVAMKDKVFSELVSIVRDEINTEEGRAFRLENKNELIGRYRGAIGVKTGFTNRAGKCLITVAEREGVRVLLVLLNAKDRWWGSVDMLDAAFSHAQKFKMGAK